MFCSQCGAERPDGATACPRCGAAAPAAAPRPVYVNTASSSAAEHIIPAKNPPALAAYYLGVFALIPCLGLVLGPAALILGFKGIGKSKVFPNRIGKGHAITGVILGLLTTLLNYGALLVMLAASRH